MKQGKLIYVMGPSGSGKDSVMNYARAHCPSAQAAFAHRYITRAADAGGENHVFLHPDEFQARADRGLFSLHWDSHGYRYGLGREIEMWMDTGLNVVMNGSRGYLPEAASLFPNIQPVLISVEPSILKERLLNRGRETLDEIEKRLDRAEAYEVSHTGLERIDNSGELVDAGKAMLAIIRQRPRRLPYAV